MSKAHIGNIMGLQGEYILPINFEDKLFPFYWNTWSRDIQPIIDISTIIPDDKFGQVIAVEDGTTNVIPQSDLSTLHGWNSTDSTNSYAVQTSDGFWRVPKINAVTGRTNTEILMDKSYVVTAGETWTESFYFRHDGTSIGFNFTFYTNNGHHTIPATIIKVGPNLYRAHATYTVETGGIFIRAIDIKDFTGNWTYIDIKNAQLEKKSWPTSFVEGTRVNGALVYPKELINLNQFTINTWFKINVQLSSYQPILELCSSAHQYNRLLIMVESSGNAISTWYANNVDNNSFSSSFVPIINQWHMFTLTFDGSKYIMYADGKEVARRDTTTIVTPDANATLNIGGRYWGRLNGQLSNFLICPRAVSPEEIRIWYDYGKPFYDPYNYTAIYG